QRTAAKPTFGSAVWHSAVAPVQLLAGAHASASALHAVPADSNPSAGQASLTPSQCSSTSQAPAAGRQTAVLLPSAGQVGPVPVQVSATSQSPAAGRHSTAAGLKASAGHALSVPVQSSASSHEPMAPRHSNVEGSSRSAGQLPLAPVQNSATSQPPAAGRQSVVAGSNRQVDEQQSPSCTLPSSHCSPGSRTPSPQRRTRNTATAVSAEPAA